jgi:hypothetical protein
VRRATWLNTDEYRADAETTAMRLPEAGDAHDLRRIVHAEFVQWFGASTARGLERYADVAREIWVRHRAQ